MDVSLYFEGVYWNLESCQNFSAITAFAWKRWTASGRQSAALQVVPRRSADPEPQPLPSPSLRWSLVKPCREPRLRLRTQRRRQTLSGLSDTLSGQSLGDKRAWGKCLRIKSDKAAEKEQRRRKEFTRLCRKDGRSVQATTIIEHVLQQPRVPSFPEFQVKEKYTFCSVFLCGKTRIPCFKSRVVLLN